MKHSNNSREYSSTPKSLIISAYKVWTETSKEYILRRRAAFNYLADLCKRADMTVDDAREAYDQSIYGNKYINYHNH